MPQFNIQVDEAVPGLAQDLLASLLSLNGRTTEAVAQRRAALEKLEKILGPDHPELQPSVDQLAIDLLRLEDFAGATPILQRTWQRRVAQLGPEHPDTLERLALLTECLLAARLASEALPLLQEQLSLSERLKGPDHEDTLTVLQLVARAYDQQGDRESAGGLLRRAESGLERTLGSTHPKTLASIYTLFENLSEGANPAAAEPYGEKLFLVSQQVHGYSHPLTISAATMVANFYVQRNNPDAAVALLRRALAAFPDNQASPTREQAQLQCRLAACLDLDGKINEAEGFARTAAYALQVHLGRSHGETERAWRYAVDLWMRRRARTPWGRFRLLCMGFLGRILSRKGSGDG